MKQETEFSSEKRLKKGKAASFLGVASNLALSLGKILAGHSFGAVSLIADGVNNLADAAASVVMLFGFVISSKPADREHPYGHARSEALSSLVVGILILVAGFEFFKSSVQKILHPAAIETSPILFAVLIASILFKAALAVFFGIRGKKILSESLLAASADSRNDAFMTSLILICATLEKNFGLKIDGIAGVLLSAFIFWSGFSIAKKTVSSLMGQSADPALKKHLIERIESYPEVIGCHDLMIHDYGPQRRYASIHVEMDKNTDSMLCHDRIDQIERECKEEFGIHLVIHYDPVSLDDPEEARLKNLVETLLSLSSPRLLIHDFRLVRLAEKSILYFDLVIPGELLGKEAQIEENLKEALFKIEGKVFELEITPDPET